MITKDTPKHKALYFDLDTKKLRKHYSKTSPNGGYRMIYNFLHINGFKHVQGSVYHSVHCITDTVVIILIYEMVETLTWFDKCVKAFDVATLGENHDLVKIINNREKVKFIH